MSRRAAPPKRKCRSQVYESRHRQAPQARSDRSSPQARAPEDRHVPVNAVSNILTDIRYHHILSVYPREQGKFCKINFHNILN